MRRLYEICSICSGDGINCPGGCRMRSVSDTGLTIGQVDRMLERLAAAELVIAAARQLNKHTIGHAPDLTPLEIDLLHIALHVTAYDQEFPPIIPDPWSPADDDDDESQTENPPPLEADHDPE